MWEGKPATGLRTGSNTCTNYDDPTAAQVQTSTTPVNPTQSQIDAATNFVGYKNAVNASGLCGYADWRLPTTDELQTLVDYSRAYPAGASIDTTWFTNTPAFSFYWSASDTRSVSTTSTLGVYFLNGGVGYMSRASMNGYVRLVR
jgi:hypothetical protein